VVEPPLGQVNSTSQVPVHPLSVMNRSHSPTHPGATTWSSWCRG